MDLLNVPGATGDYHTDFDAKAKACLENIRLDKYDFGFCHLKAVDDAGHDQDAEKKIYYLEKMDTMIGSIITSLRKDTDTNVRYYIYMITNNSIILYTFLSIQLSSQAIIQHLHSMVIIVVNLFHFVLVKLELLKNLVVILIQLNHSTKFQQQEVGLVDFVEIK